MRNFVVREVSAATSQMPIKSPGAIHHFFAIFVFSRSFCNFDRKNHRAINKVSFLSCLPYVLKK